MAEKYYAVKTGAETGIFTTWEECRASVHGYSGAAYKSFKTREEAAAYLEDNFSGKDGLKDRDCAVSYTHLTLPTIRLAWISVVAVFV